MKKTLIYCTTFILLLLSCKKDPLDITPDGRITLEDVFKDENKTEAYLNTVYSAIPLYFWRYQFLTFLAGITDEAQDGDVGNEPTNIAAQWITGGLTPSYNPLNQSSGENGADHYSGCWAGIRDVNIFLTHIDKAVISNEAKRSRLKSEAQVLRAFYYLELIKQYGPLPVIDKVLGPTFDYTTLTRPTFQENIDFIVNDCNLAIANPNLPLRIKVESERGRFTKAIAYAIKSQALLYNASPLWNSSGDQAKWNSASVASKAALDALTGSGYELYPNYGNYFLLMSDIGDNPLDKETIYERPEVSNGTFGIINGIPSKPGVFKVGVCPSQELVDSYDMQETGEPAILGYNDQDHLRPIINNASGYNENKPYLGRDPRFYATVWYNGALYDNVSGSIHTIETFIGGADQLVKTPPNRFNTHTGYYLRKFLDPRVPSGQGQNSRWKKYRLAEIYLNYAEAENEVNGANSNVYNAINKVRERADMPDLPSGLTKEQMRERIHKERRVELAIEEHRFWDVRRWKILKDTDRLVTGIEITRNANSTFNYTRFVAERRVTWSDKYLVFPIPIGDASNIPNFGKNQNPGW